MKETFNHINCQGKDEKKALKNKQDEDASSQFTNQEFWPKNFHGNLAYLVVERKVMIFTIA